VDAYINTLARDQDSLYRAPFHGEW